MNAREIFSKHPGKKTRYTVLINSNNNIIFKYSNFSLTVLNNLEGRQLMGSILTQKFVSISAPMSKISLIQPKPSLIKNYQIAFLKFIYPNLKLKQYSSVQRENIAYPNITKKNAAFPQLIWLYRCCAFLQAA